MKYLFLILLWSCNIQTKVCFLTPKEPKIEAEIVKTVFEHLEENSILEKSVIVLNINNIDDTYEIKATGLEKEELRWYLEGKRERLFGYTDFNRIPVMIYGNSAHKFYNKTKDKTSFDFLIPYKHTKEKNKGKIADEPEIFEPMVWVYFYHDDKFELLVNEMALPFLN